MKTIRSVLLWSAGGIHFVLFFLIMSIGLVFLNPRTLYPTLRYLLRMQLMVMRLRVKADGYDRFESDGSYLIMGNHESLFDVFVIPAAVPMHAVGIEAAYHFSIPLWGYMAKKWGNIPIFRSKLDRAIKTLDKAAQVLKSGTSIVILPEGHRTLTGHIGPFKKGPFHLAMAANADILPFAINGLYEYRSKKGWQIHPLKARVTFGAPIPYDVYKNDEISDIQQKVRQKIIDLKKCSQGNR